MFVIRAGNETEKSWKHYVIGFSIIGTILDWFTHYKHMVRVCIVPWKTLFFLLLICPLQQIKVPIAVAARSLRPIACWNYGFESRREHGCLSLVSVVCVVRYRSLRRVDHRSKLVLRNLVCLCDLGTSKVRRLSSH